MEWGGGREGGYVVTGSDESAGGQKKKKGNRGPKLAPHWRVPKAETEQFRETKSTPASRSRPRGRRPRPHGLGNIP